MRTRLAVSIPILAIAARGAPANPVTPPSHAEAKYRAIGGGLFLARDEKFQPDDDGNTAITVFSRFPISAPDARYSVDLSRLAGKIFGASPGDLAVDAGTLGELRVQLVTIDCAHQTYEVVDTRAVLPEFIWRNVSTLPALRPLFTDVCSVQRSRSPKPEPSDDMDTDARPPASDVDLRRQTEMERLEAERKVAAERAEIQQQAAARIEEMPGEYRNARKQSGYGARLRATGFRKIPVGGSDGVCSKLLVMTGWSKPLADVACREQTVKECSLSLTTESVSAKDMPLVSTVVATSTTGVCARVLDITRASRQSVPKIVSPASPR